MITEVKLRTGAVGTKEQYDRATMRSFNQPLFTQEHNAEYSPASDSQGKLVVGDKRLRFVTGTGTRTG